LLEVGREARAQSKARRAEGNTRFAAAAALQWSGIDVEIFGGWVW